MSDAWINVVAAALEQRPIVVSHLVVDSSAAFDQLAQRCAQIGLALFEPLHPEPRSYPLKTLIFVVRRKTFDSVDVPVAFASDAQRFADEISSQAAERLASGTPPIAIVAIDSPSLSIMAETQALLSQTYGDQIAFTRRDPLHLGVGWALTIVHPGTIESVRKALRDFEMKEKV